MTTDRPISDLSFEDALRELETVVQRLERGDVALEESIALYERGAALKAACEKRLRDATEKVERLTLSQDGTPTGTTPFDPA